MTKYQSIHHSDFLLFILDSCSKECQHLYKRILFLRFLVKLFEKDQSLLVLHYFKHRKKYCLAWYLYEVFFSLRFLCNDILSRQAIFTLKFSKRHLPQQNLFLLDIFLLIKPYHHFHNILLQYKSSFTPSRQFFHNILQY